MAVIVWFRNDLRVADNPALWHAQQSGGAILPVYIWEGKEWMGVQRMGPHRRQFIMGCLADLNNSLEELGSKLYVYEGNALKILKQLAKAYKATAIYAANEPGWEEQQQQKEVAAFISLRTWDSGSLYATEDMPFPPAQVPDLFSQFQQRVTHSTLVRSTLPRPEYLYEELPEGSQKIKELKIKAEPMGETAAWQQLNQYFWEEDQLRTYKLKRDGLDKSGSGLSAYLAQGCISPRQVYEEVRRYEQERIKNDSTYWLYFELLWREYFRAVASKFGPLLFRDSGIMKVEIPWKENEVHLAAWQQGRTGYPLVDAIMHQLKEEGWISNRARQIVASFLTKNLHLDWRLGALWFEHWLTDYDVCSNYGNWNYVAGVGNDGRGYRFFHVDKQAKTYDPQGEYVARYLAQTTDYPTPIVDLLQTAREGETMWKHGFKASGIHKRISRIRKFVR